MTQWASLRHSVKLLSDSAAPIRSNGKVTGAVLVFRDITQKSKPKSSSD